MGLWQESGISGGEEGEGEDGKTGIRTNWRRAEQAADLSGKSALIYV
jgi:hypothetical protein